ncbi:MAG: hypothetical protein NVSMB38_32300 [Ktedonobacteraceae bacterium]
MQPPTPPKKKAWYKKPWGIALIIFLALGVCGGISNAFSHNASATTSTTTAPTDTPVPTDTPMPTDTPIPPSIHYPPTTEADLHGLAIQGNADAIHGFHSESVGLTGACPQPKREVTVDPGITGKRLAEDLLAYFYAEQLNNPCGSIVFAYHTQAEANDPNGGAYTAGRIMLDVTDASGANNLGPNASGLKYALTLDVGGFDANQEYVVTY